MTHKWRIFIRMLSRQSEKIMSEIDPTENTSHIVQTHALKYQFLCVPCTTFLSTEDSIFRRFYHPSSGASAYKKQGCCHST